MSGLFTIARRAVDKVRGRYRGPTWDWPPGTVTRLSYDMRDRALNGVPLGAPLEQLRPLGPAGWSDRDGSEIKLYYYRLGLFVRVEAGRIRTIEVVFDAANTWEHAWHPLAEGRVAVRNAEGRWGDLTRSTTEEEVVALLGAPVSSHDYDDERTYEFIGAGHEISVKRDTRTGGLIHFEIDPIADPPVLS